MANLLTSLPCWWQELRASNWSMRWYRGLEIVAGGGRHKPFLWWVPILADPFCQGSTGEMTARTQMNDLFKEFLSSKNALSELKSELKNKRKKQYIHSNYKSIKWFNDFHGCSRRNDITQHLKIVPCYIITSYLAGVYFQALRNIIAPAAPMVRQQSSLIITLELKYSSYPYQPRKSPLLIFRWT